MLTILFRITSFILIVLLFFTPQIFAECSRYYAPPGYDYSKVICRDTKKCEYRLCKSGQRPFTAFKSRSEVINCDDLFKVTEGKSAVCYNPQYIQDPNNLDDLKYQSSQGLWIDLLYLIGRVNDRPGYHSALLDFLEHVVRNPRYDHLECNKRAYYLCLQYTGGPATGDPAKAFEWKTCYETTAAACIGFRTGASGLN